MTPSGPPPSIAREIHVGGPRVYELTGWRAKNNTERMRVLAEIARNAAPDPRLARLAVGIFTRAGVRPRDYRGQAEALHDFVRDHVYFLNEDGERLQDPAYTLDLQADGNVGPRAAGDCDDKTIAYAALCQSILLPTRMVTTGRKGKQRVRYVEGVGTCPRGAKWSHVYVAVGLHPFRRKYDPTTWAFSDCTVPGAPFGWDVMAAGASDPQRSARAYGDASDDDLAGMSVRGALQLAGVGVGTALIIRLLQKRGWWP